MIVLEPADYKDVGRDANFIAKEGEDKVLQLKKALYGIKQVPRAWYSSIDEFL